MQLRPLVLHGDVTFAGPDPAHSGWWLIITREGDVIHHHHLDSRPTMLLTEIPSSSDEAHPTPAPAGDDLDDLFAGLPTGDAEGTTHPGAARG